MGQTGVHHGPNARWRRLPLIAAILVAILTLYAEPPVGGPHVR